MNADAPPATEISRKTTVLIAFLILVGLGCVWLAYGWFSRHDPQLRSAILPIESATLDVRDFEKTGSGLVVIRGFSLWIKGADGTQYRCHAGKASLLCRPDTFEIPSTTYHMDVPR